jgi:hypothetical protein
MDENPRTIRSTQRNATLTISAAGVHPPAPAAASPAASDPDIGAAWCVCARARAHTHTHTLCIRRSDAPDAKPGYYRAFGSASFLDDKQRVIFPLGKDKYEIKAGPGSKVRGGKKKNRKGYLS